MVTDVLPGEWIELPSAVVAAIAAELPAAASGSALASARYLADGSTVAWEGPLEERGLIEDGELMPWLARSMSVLLWPEALVLTRDTIWSPPASRFIAADTLVRYEQAEGKCRVGRPTQRDAFVDDLVALCTTAVDRFGDPPVLELTRWTLQAIETVLGTDRTHAAARAALATVTSAPDAPDTIIEAMVDDELLAEAGAVFVPGPALAGWSDALDSRRRLEIQRLDLADDPDEAQVRTMVFIGAPGDRCLVMPLGGDKMLLVKPTIDEATALIDAFLTPAPPAVQPDAFEVVAASWRASADNLIAADRR